MSSPMVIEVTARDNRLGWWGQLRYHKAEFPCFSRDYIDKAFEMLPDYEWPVSITVDGRQVYPREDKR